jgi:MIP family channel proteins
MRFISQMDIKSAFDHFPSEQKKRVSTLSLTKARMSDSEDIPIHTHPQVQSSSIELLSPHQQHQQQQQQQPQQSVMRSMELTHEERQANAASSPGETVVRVNFPLKEFCRQNRAAVAEFWGTYILVTFGCGSLASCVLNRDVDSGDYFSITVGWGIGLMLAVYVSVNHSGAHLNPAVSVALAVFNRFDWSKVKSYVIAQFCGAFFAAVSIYAVYSSALYQHDGGVRAIDGYNGTAGLFATYPAAHVTLPVAFMNEMVGTACLLFVICAITDKDNTPANKWAPLAIGFTLLAIGISWGWQTGFALNPARDFAPRLFTMLGGWGFEVFTHPDGYWWIPLIAPFIGATAGVGLYELFVSQRLLRSCMQGY